MGNVFVNNSLGGDLSGGSLSGLSAVDNRIQIHEVGPGGTLNLIYTTPVLAANQSGDAYVQVVDVDNAGRAVGLYGSLSIGLSGSSGNTLPQPYVKYTVPVNGQSNVGRNINVVLYFSKPLDPATVTTNTVRLWTYSGDVAGSYSLADGPAGQNSMLTITPAVQLNANQVYNIYAYTGIRSADGQPLLSAFSASFSTGLGSDTTPPSVANINPPDGAAGIGFNQTINIYISEPVNPATVTSFSVRLLQGATQITGRFRINTGNGGPSSLITFIPDQALLANTIYTIEVANGITDTVGLPITNPQTTTFTTGSRIDNAHPSILTFSPPNSQTGVPLNVRIEVLFDEVIDVVRLNSQSIVVQGYSSGVISGILTPTADHRGLVYTFNEPLSPNMVYYLRIGTQSPIYDLAGNALLNSVNASFTTGIEFSDTIPPSVIQVNPADSATNFAINGVIELQFSEPVAPTSINNQSIVVSASNIPVEAEFGFRSNNRIITIKPANLFLWQASTAYDIQVTNNVRDISNNAVVPFNSIFTTGTGTDTARPTIVSITPAENTVIDPAQPSEFVITFSEAINPITIAEGIAMIRYGSGGSANLGWTHTLSADKTVLTIRSSEPATIAGASIRFDISNALKDIAGNTFAGCIWCRVIKMQWQAPVDIATVFTGAAITTNPISLYADGSSATRVTISNINRNGALVPNGTKVAVTVAPIYRNDSAGGAIIEGEISAYDSRYRMFTTLGGSISFNYQSPDLPDLKPGETRSGFIQAAPVGRA